MSSQETVSSKAQHRVEWGDFLEPFGGFDVYRE